MSPSNKRDAKCQGIVQARRQQGDMQLEGAALERSQQRAQELLEPVDSFAEENSQQQQGVSNVDEASIDGHIVELQNMHSHHGGGSVAAAAPNNANTAAPAQSSLQAAVNKRPAEATRRSARTDRTKKTDDIYDWTN